MEAQKVKISIVFYSIHAAALLSGCGVGVEHISTESAPTVERSIATLPGANLALGISGSTLYIDYLSGTDATGGAIKNCDLSVYFFSLYTNGKSTASWSRNLLKHDWGTDRCGSTEMFPLAAPIGGKYTVKLQHPSLGNNLEASMDITPPPPPPPPPPPRGEVMGWVDGFSGNTLSGWACDKGMPKSIDVHFYLDGPPPGGIGPFVTTTNLTREMAVVSACGTSFATHGWSIDAAPARAAYAGRKIYAYGISVSGGPNLELHNSGVFTIPR